MKSNPRAQTGAERRRRRRQIASDSSYEPYSQEVAKNETKTTTKSRQKKGINGGKNNIHTEHKETRNKPRPWLGKSKGKNSIQGPKGEKKARAPNTAPPPEVINMKKNMTLTKRKEENSRRSILDRTGGGKYKSP